MKLRFLCSTLLLAFFMASTAFAYNVTVKTSAGTGIASVNVLYNNNGGGTYLVATTDGSGVATIPGGQNYVNVQYHLSSTGWINTGGADITFYTTTVTAKVVTCGGVVVPGASFRFNPGTTEAGTWLWDNPVELFAGTWWVAADIYGDVRNTQTPTLPGNNTAAGLTWTVTFKTVKVTGAGAGTLYCDALHDGLYSYYRLSFTPAAGIELLPGNYYFKNGTSANIGNGTIVGPYNIGTGCSFILPHKVIVKTSAGVGIPNVSVSYNNNGGGTWLNVTTDANGVATIPGGQNFVDLRNYKLGTTGWVNTGGADITFFTTAVTAVVKSCMTGNVIPGASFRFNPGTTLGGTWLTGSTQELLAGTWCVGADILGHVRNTQTPTLPGNNTAAGLTLTVTFLTTQVTSGGAGTFYIDPLHDGLYNYYRLGPFTSASVIELLPGSYYFKINSTSAHYLNGNIVGPFAVSGCSMAGVGTSPPPPKIVGEQSELGLELIPTEFGLAQNYPNPFNPSTTLRYALPVDATVTLDVYDILGEKVAQLVNGPVVAGYHDVVFNAANLPSGIYFYRMSAAANGNHFTRIEKMMLLK